MKKKKIKVVWICNVMNDVVKQHLYADISLSRWFLIFAYKIISHILSECTRNRLENYLYFKPQSDYGQWNTNAIKEFESIVDVDLHVIIPVNMTSSPLEEFDLRNIHYHIVKSHDSILHKALRNRVKLPSYKYDRKVMASIIDSISPDIVHVIGAENPQYSQVIFDVYKKYPVIVQLQTLLSNPNNPISGGINPQIIEMEKRILSLPIFIATDVQAFKRTILSVINPNAVFFDLKLAVTEPITRKDFDKKYDFVYFSANIDKAADLAVPAFCLAAKKRPEITLDIIGAYSSDYKAELEKELVDNGIRQNVTFEGSLPTHEDVIRKIREARFALLPLKIDFVSGTIREACSNGLPVITTKTEGTPLLNKVRETVLLSEIGDAATMANNMIRVIEDSELAAKLKENGYLYAEGLTNNRDAMNKCVDAYKTILKVQ